MGTATADISRANIEQIKIDRAAKEASELKAGEARLAEIRANKEKQELELTAREADKMTDEEQSLYKQKMIIVHKGMKAFLEVGTALAEIRNLRLFRNSHKNFDSWLAETLPTLGKIMAQHLITAVEIVEDIKSSAVEGEVITLPVSEGSIRDLAKLPRNMRGEAWKAATELAKEKNKTSPTGAMVREVVEEFKVELKEANADKPSTSKTVFYDLDKRGSESKMRHKVPAENRKLYDSTLSDVLEYLITGKVILFSSDRGYRVARSVRASVDAAAAAAAEKAALEAANTETASSETPVVEDTTTSEVVA